MDKSIPQSIMGVVLRFALGDCTNNGSSSRNDSLRIFSEGTDINDAISYCTTHNINPHDVFIIETLWKGTPNEYKRAVHILPQYTDGVYMAGGNYLKLYGDFDNIKYPIAIHDRFEKY